MLVRIYMPCLRSNLVTIMLMPDRFYCIAIGTGSSFGFSSIGKMGHIRMNADMVNVSKKRKQILVDETNMIQNLTYKL